MTLRRAFRIWLAVVGAGSVVILVLAVFAAEPDPATRDATTTSANPTTVEPAAAERLVGFGRQAIDVSGALWSVAVADTPALRSQGLMGVTDLGDVDGMLFVFDEDTSSGFWMKDTLISLDVAFFRADGTLVDLLSMVPCADDPCPQYHPSGSYRYGLEATPGAFDGLEPLELVISG